MSSSSTIFAGTSRYSSDLQQVLTRAVAIASLPLNQLNSQLSALQTRSSAIDALSSNFAAIQTAVESLNTGVTSASASVSDPTVAQAQADGNTLPGTYSLNVIDPGSQTAAISVNGLPTVADPSNQSITTASSLTLSVNGVSFSLNPSSNSLNALAAAINSSGAGVTATIVNLGPPSAPDYRLSVQSEALGSNAIQINDGSQDVLEILVAGTPARYQVNGQPASPIFSNSRTVVVAPGLTAILLTAGSANIVVSRTSSALVTALSSFVTAYNAAVDGLGQHRGTRGGALTGDPILATLTQSLRNLSGYSGGSGAVQSLASLGITLSKTGKLSLDEGTLNGAVAAHPNDVGAFLGSASTGGFLEAATSSLSLLEDPGTGVFQNLHAQMQTQIARQNQHISDMQTRIDLMQANMTARIAAADAMIASLEQQVSYFTTLFGSMSDYGRNQNR